MKTQEKRVSVAAEHPEESQVFRLLCICSVLSRAQQPSVFSPHLNTIISLRQLEECRHFFHDLDYMFKRWLLFRAHFASTQSRDAFKETKTTGLASIMDGDVCQSFSQRTMLVQAEISLQLLDGQSWTTEDEPY